MNVKSLITRAGRWAAAFSSWLLRGSWPYFLPPGLAVAAARLPWWGPAESRVRLAGLALQLAGVAAVFVQMERTRAHFGHETFGARVRAWWGRRPWSRGHVVTIGDVAAVNLNASVRGIGTVTPDPNAPLPERVGRLERIFNDLFVVCTQKSWDHEDALEKERREREAVEKRIRAELEAAATKDLRVAEMGAFWLFAGVALSTASPEIAKWFGAGP